MSTAATGLYRGISDPNTFFLGGVAVTSVNDVYNYLNGHVQFNYTPTPGYGGYMLDAFGTYSW